MKRFLLAAAASAVALTAAAPAQAVDLTTLVILDSTNSADIGARHGGTLEPSGTTFADTFNFATPATFSNATAAAAVIEVAVSNTNFLTLTSLALNGGQSVNFTVTSMGTMTVYSAAVMSTAATLPALNSLVVRGTVNGTGGSYGGNVSVTEVAVPEPATWGLMLMGFGMVGFGLRARKAARVTFA